MKLTICAVGRLRKGPEADLINDYLMRATRTGRALGFGTASVTEVEDKKGGGMAAEAAGRQAMEHGMKKVDVFVKGPGSGRETAIRSLSGVGIEVGTISDVTPSPHNGCRPPKHRRL